MQHKKKENEVIGVQLKRSKEMVLTILGILKAGCAYVPIENYYPENRKNYIFNDADINILITSKDLQYDFCQDKQIIFVDDNETYSGDDSNLDIVLNPFDLAYIEYTSGSTGEPKGVMIENHSVVNTIMDLERRFPVQEGDVYLYKTPFSFDISGTELYGWFMGKGALCILEHDGEKNPELILEFIDRYHVTHINFVPNMLKVFLELLNEKNNKEKLHSLRWIFVGGEALTADIIDKFFDMKLAVNLENVYPAQQNVQCGLHTILFKNASVFRMYRLDIR
ncbi:Hybrid non-ribosomal peptide synthetase/type I polyketide synthase OS=Lysinibacillus sphaericus OX=1421 GN=LS41612_16930 PE=3 SV=1 [Lysinibacillus sphaericus]